MSRALRLHPRQNLRKVAYKNKRSCFAATEDSRIQQHEQKQKTTPAKRGIEKGCNGGTAAIVKVFKIIEDRPDVQNPLIPTGRIGVLCIYRGVVGQHELLVIENYLCILITEGTAVLRIAVGNIAEVIN